MTNTGKGSVILGANPGRSPVAQPDRDLIEIDQQEPGIRGTQPLLDAVSRWPGESIRGTAGRLAVQENGDSQICLGHANPPMTEHAATLSTRPPPRAGADEPARFVAHAGRCDRCHLQGDTHFIAEPSARLQARLRSDFREPSSADALIDKLRALDTEERIQAAIVLWARGDVNRFRDSLALAHVDWRDVLVRGGLENDDWEHVLDSALPN